MLKLGEMDGKTIWSQDLHSTISFSAAEGSYGHIFVGTGEGLLYAIDSDDGSIIWSELTTEGSGVTSPAIGPWGTVYAASYDGFLYALRPDDGSRKWRVDIGGRPGVSPVVDEAGRIFVPGYDSASLHAFDEDGNDLFEVQATAHIYGSPALGDDNTVYFADTAGVVFAVDATTGETRWTFDLAEPLYGSLTLADDGTLYVPGVYTLVALDTDSGGPANSSWAQLSGGASHQGLAPDTDGDGLLDLVDENPNEAIEQCDDLDNDGDGAVDEGFDVGGDSDGDGVINCRDTEECDGVDNDGDGVSDEGFDEDGNGVGSCVDIEVCDGFDNDGDDLIDEGFDADTDGVVDCEDIEDCDGEDNDGDGVVDEDITFTTWFADSDGDSFGDSATAISACDGGPEGYVTMGGDCNDSLPSVFPGAEEACDGIADNDCSGEVDPREFDGDGDGQSACDLDCDDEDPLNLRGGSEVCDGGDNDCDSFVDEGLDADGDGIPNCLDPEVCDALDNDGDERVDEGFDNDGDGIADCLDRETCDGVDNDGDQDIDEGFDDDGDGIADCFDVETCDGFDNDGDDVSDEGFDSDSDGIADCFDVEVCDELDNDGDGDIDEGYDSDEDGIPDCQDTEVCDRLDNDGDGTVDEGSDPDFDGIGDCIDRSILLASVDTGHPESAWNADRQESLVVFEVDVNGAGDYDIYGVRLSQSGAPLGDPFPVISTIYADRFPDIVWNSASGEYMVTAEGIVDGTWSLLALHQRVSTAGSVLGDTGYFVTSGFLGLPYEVLLYDVSLTFNAATAKYAMVLSTDLDGDGYFDLLYFNFTAGGPATDFGYQLAPEGAHFFFPEVAWGSTPNQFAVAFEFTDFTTFQVAAAFVAGSDWSPQEGPILLTDGEFAFSPVVRPKLAYDVDTNRYGGVARLGSTSEDADTGEISFSVRPNGSFQPSGVLTYPGYQVLAPSLAYSEDEGEYLVSMGVRHASSGAQWLMAMRHGQGLAPVGSTLLVRDHPAFIEQNPSSNIHGSSGEVLLSYEADHPDADELRVQRVTLDQPSLGAGEERCDGFDNDVDGLVDEGHDSDGDGLGDCQDTEECDGLDNDGDGAVDEEQNFSTWYADNDGDGHGRESTGVLTCSGAPTGYIDVAGDCDDGNSAVYPGAPEICDGIVDNDCDGGSDATDLDVDGDGQRVCEGDCDDTDPVVASGRLEVCDGHDNDCDGAIDQGFDSDEDGVADCFDVEECDGVDNDGDHFVDEAFDIDDDGLADCFDPEECDGVDNDGDDQVDEGFDSDVDEVADCFDIETCDGLDNDGDNLVDEGFDSDQDSVADCFDEETCDGLDNNGNGLVDEGFDSDGDGVVDCEDSEQCDGLDNDGDERIDEGFDSDTDGEPDCIDEEECDGLDNDGDQLVDEGFNVDGDDLADCFDEESCDDQDNDGDGRVDEGLDADGDGLADCYDSEDCDGLDNDGDQSIDEGLDSDGDGIPNCEDTEECDWQDNDGDGSVDEGLAFEITYADADTDGFGDPDNASRTCDGPPEGHVLDDTDCDDSNPAVHPGASQSCDGIADTDCDGQDDPLERDDDGDGQTSCEGDCDDADSGRSSDQSERCDGEDNDCDGESDEGFDPTTWYADRDGDGFGDGSVVVVSCDGSPENHVAVGGDCDDGNEGVYPHSTALCDGVVDTDCDGQPDTDDGDLDGDGFGTCQGDCDDRESQASPALEETCDGAVEVAIDNDCDGLVDEGIRYTTYYQDLDGDVHGNESESLLACDGAPVGYTSMGGDCDDGRIFVHEGSIDICDGVADNDCDGVTDPMESDDDGDGFTECLGDCDDSSPDIYPEAEESCSGTDQDCDGSIDEDFVTEEGDVPVCSLSEVCDGMDNDGDGQVDESLEDVQEIEDNEDNDCDGRIDESTGAFDDDSDGYTENQGDCDDANALTFPAAAEICDDSDNDCDGTTDEGSPPDSPDACVDTPLLVGAIGRINVGPGWSEIYPPPGLIDPVIIFGPPTGHEGEAAVVRADVTDGFALRLDPWDVDDLTQTESVDYAVLSSGLYRLPDGGLLEIGTLPVGDTLNRNWQPLSFKTSFPAPPRVVLSVQTYAGRQAITPRARHISESGVEIGLMEQERFMDGHVGELVGYMALYLPEGEASLSISGEVLDLRTGRTMVSSEWSQVEDLALRMEEETTVTPETTHVMEDVDLIRLGSHVFAQAVSLAGTDPATLRSFARDCDADGLVDILDSDWDSDSDGDGMTDCYEDLYSTCLSADDPGDADEDCDHDGLSNLQESNLGSNPEEPDTDEDGALDLVDSVPTDPAYLGSEVGIASIGDGWGYVEFETKFNDPVVIHGVLGDSLGIPAVPRMVVDNVGFELRAQPMDYLGDTTIEGETLPYLVIERGRHLAYDGVVFEAGSFEIDGTDLWSRISFVEPFEVAPQVYLSLQTVNGSQAAWVRSDFVTNEGFDAALFEQELFMDGHNAEVVSYLAVYSESDDALMNLGGEWLPALQQRAYVDTAPSIIGGYSLYLQEEQSHDAETTHVVESVEVLLLGSSTFAQVASVYGGDPVVVRQSSERSEATAEWGVISQAAVGLDIRMPFRNNYLEPIIIAQAIHASGVPAGVTRVVDSSQESFIVRFQPWSSGEVGAFVDISYLVVEKGAGHLGELAYLSGQSWVDGTFNREAQDDGWLDMSLQESFGESPVIIGTLQLSEDPSPIGFRVRNVTSASWETILQRPESEDSEHGGEWLGWIAIDRGESPTRQGEGWAFATSEIVDHLGTTLPYPEPASVRAPVVLTSVNSALGGDPVTGAVEDVTASDLRLFLQEEQTADEEVSHYDESMGVLVLD